MVTHKNQKDGQISVFFRARRLAGTGDPSKALGLIDSWISENHVPSVHLLLLKGSILEMLRKYATAIELYRSVLDSDPRNTLALVDLADCYSKLSPTKRPMAMRLYNRALGYLNAGYFFEDHQNEFVEGLIGKGTLLLETGRCLDACKVTVSGLVRYPTDILLIDQLQRAAEQYRKMLKRKHD